MPGLYELHSPIACATDEVLENGCCPFGTTCPVIGVMGISIPLLYYFSGGKSPKS